MRTATSTILNLDELLNRVDDDCELLVEIFDIFKTDYPGHLQRLGEAINGQDAHKVETEGHTLKGMLLNLSAVRRIRRDCSTCCVRRSTYCWRIWTSAPASFVHENFDCR